MPRGSPLPSTATVPSAAGCTWCLSLPCEGEWKAEDRGIEFLNDAAAARAGRRDFELRRRLRRARAARLRVVEGMQTSCMLADVVVVSIEG